MEVSAANSISLRVIVLSAEAALLKTGAFTVSLFELPMVARKSISDAERIVF